MKRSTNDNGGGGNHSIQKAPSKSSSTCCRFYVCVCVCVSVLVSACCACISVSASVCVCVCLSLPIALTHSCYALTRPNYSKLSSPGRRTVGSDYCTQSSICVELLRLAIEILRASFCSVPTALHFYCCWFVSNVFIFLRVNKQNKKNME